MNAKSCPICASVALSFFTVASVSGDDDDEPLLTANEHVGIVFNEEKVGSFDWQRIVVGIECSNKHVFWIDAPNLQRNEWNSKP